jgi:hypothetical protein
MKLLKHFITLVIVGFVIFIAIDFLCLERPQDLRVDNPSDASAQLVAQLHVKSTIYDLASHSFKATVNVYLKAADGRNIDNVAFSLVDAGSREWRFVDNRRSGSQDTQQAGECQLLLVGIRFTHQTTIGCGFHAYAYSTIIRNGQSSGTSVGILA